MKTGAPTYVILLVTFIIYNGCKSDITSSDEVEFELIDRFDNKSRQSNLPQNESTKSVHQALLTMFYGIAKNEVDALYFADEAHQAVKSIRNEELKKYEYTLIAEDFANKKYELIQNEIVGVSKYLRSISRALFKNNLLKADGDFEDLLTAFADPSSVFQDYPEFVSLILALLAHMIEDFMKAVNSNTNQSQLKQSDVPCIFLDTVNAYFHSTLLYRLNEIEMNNTDFDSWEWSKKIKRIFKDPFKPNGYDEYDIKNLNCMTQEKFEHYDKSCQRDKSSGQYNFGKFSCSRDYFTLSSVEDRLGIGNKLYYGNSSGTCAIDYLSLVRHRLELFLGETYNIVLPLCPVGHFERKNFEGDYLLYQELATHIQNGLNTSRSIKLKKCSI